MRHSRRLPSAFLLLVLGASLPFSFLGCGGNRSYKSASPRVASADRDYDGVADQDDELSKESGGSGMAASSPSPEPEKKAEDKDGDGKPDVVTTWKRSAVSTHAARLMIGDKDELPLRGQQVRVDIDGFRARVLFDLYFENADAQSYEGTFQLRLPEDASPYFFAFGETQMVAKPKDPVGPVMFVAADAARQMHTGPVEIMTERAEAWSQPKEARMVPREKAAFAYGETVRRRVDPALMEWSGAGVFSARVFPLTGGKVHRIVFGYDVNLEAVGADIEWKLELPDGHPETVVDLSLAGTAVTPQVSPTAKPVSERGRAFYRFDRLEKGQTVTVRFPKPGALALVGGGDAGAAATDPGALFAVGFQPELPASASAGRDSAVFVLDTSLSSSPDRFQVWLTLLEEILTRNRGQLKKFAVLSFDVEARWWRDRFEDNTPANVAALKQQLAETVLEGASDLGAALRTAAAPAWSTGSTHADVFLLSDGSATWGESNPWALAKSVGADARLFAYRTGMAGTDTGMLAHLARESGGAVFSLVGEAEVAAAAVAHRSRPWSIKKLAIAGTSDLLLAGRPTALFPGQRVLLAGRGTLEKGHKIVLTLEQDGVVKDVTVPVASAVPSALAGRAYGQIAVAQLEELAPATEVIAKSYAIHFRVTGAAASLLMLDTEEDYQRFGIKPEEEAFVVKETPAATTIAAAIEASGATMGNPKAAFLRWMIALQKQPGLKLEIPASLKLVLDKMPTEAFRVDVAPLVTKGGAATMSAELKARLAKHDVDYDALTAEAERRRSKYGPADALKALSSLVEETPGDGVLARDIAYSAMAWGMGGQAYNLLKRVAVSRPWEPQTYRAMAEALSKIGRADLAMAYYEIGLAGEWDSRFGEFHRILAVDYTRFLRRVTAGDLKVTTPDYAKARLVTVGKETALDKAALVVMITWNTDNTDVDLHVIEPTGEECYYEHTETRIGGRLTQDVTRGYGPEMYVLGKAHGGKFQVRAKYFASDRNRKTARTKVYATLISGFGTPAESITDRVITLAEGKEMHDLATLTVR